MKNNLHLIYSIIAFSYLWLSAMFTSAQDTGDAFADLSIRNAEATQINGGWHLKTTVGNFGSNADARGAKVLIMLPGNVNITEMRAESPLNNARFTRYQGYIICDLGWLCRCGHPDAISGKCQYKATIHIKTTSDPSGRENFSVLVYNKLADNNPEDNYWVKKKGTSDVSGCEKM